MLLLLFSIAFGPAQYIKNVSLPLRSKRPTVIFGGPSIGYFETSKLDKRNNGFTLTFLPPSYLETIDFYEKNSVLKCVHREKFSDPTTPEHRLTSVVVKGTLSSPFFLINGYTPFEPADKKEPKGHSTIFLLNKQGEVVWSYLPDKTPPSSDHRTRTVLAKTLPNDEIALLRSYDRSYFERINWEGKVTASFTPSPTTVFHHDLLVLSTTHFLTFSTAYQKIRKPWFFWRAPLNFLSSPLVLVTENTLPITPIWDYITDHNPFYEHDWTWNEVDSKPTENNFTHANSIDENEKGYLLSLRNLNKLIFIDRKTKKTLWTVGPSLQNTFPTKGTRYNFFRQHHATFLQNKTLLLFDNGKRTSRILNLHLEETGSPALVHTYEPLPPVHSIRHGSAFQIEGEKIVGFFPNTTPGSAEPNRIIEFDSLTEKEKGRLEYHYGYPAAGYRAEPVESVLGAHKYTGVVSPCSP